MFGSNNINDEDIEVLDFDEFDSSNEFSFINGTSEYKTNNINELVDMKNRLLIQGQYPNKQVEFDFINNVYVLSEPGFDNMYVNVIQNNGIYQIIPVDVQVSDQVLGSDNFSKSIGGHQKSLSTPIGRLFSDKESGFTNVLFFIFLAGLSTGVVFMIILNFFMK